MKTKTINLTDIIPDGYIIDSLNENKTVINLKEIPKDITERIKSVEDACNELGEDDEDVKALRVIENLDIPKHIISQLQSIIIVKALNEGWIPDWSNSSQYKYFPWFDMENSSSGGFVCYGYDGRGANAPVGSRLCLKSSELAEYAGKQFKEIYELHYVIK
ncbi:hypothetical protein AS589_09270 [Empedobacter brevis]|uniref:hypothetical protein n=1 Tax=Empedobacter brevis TaxID=247 RepID=UPI00131FE717|nr:hypothetical protein [Empedobacter brevis]QHC84945.1 hypothetical protein AS589_09270 [Empedobacter brevis]